MFLTPDLMRLCLGAFFDIRQGKEAWFASSMKKRTKSGHRADQQLQVIAGRKRWGELLLSASL